MIYRLDASIIEFINFLYLPFLLLSYLTSLTYLKDRFFIVLQDYLKFSISGGLIFAGINLITTTSAFWTVSSHIVVESVASLHEFALYPMLIYPKFIGFIFTWIVPYAFASFYPANYFLHKGFANYSLLSPLIAVVLWFIALRVWNFGLSHYSSTGS